jgi:signal recognition particle GTPase
MNKKQKEIKKLEKDTAGKDKTIYNLYKEMNKIFRGLIK